MKQNIEDKDTMREWMAHRGQMVKLQACKADITCPLGGLEEV